MTAMNSGPSTMAPITRIGESVMTAIAARRVAMVMNARNVPVTFDWA